VCSPGPALRRVWAGQLWRRASRLPEVDQERLVSPGSTGMGVLFSDGGNPGPGEPLLGPREDCSAGGSSIQGWLGGVHTAPSCPP